MNEEQSQQKYSRYYLMDVAMKRILTTKHYALGVLILVMLISVTVSPASSAPIQSEEIYRGEILAIANEYATYTWTATESHIAHNGNLHTPDAETVYNSVHNHGGWWKYGENVGIPYFWGGATAIQWPGLVPLDDGLYFNEKLEQPDYFAGDVTTEYDENNNQQLASHPTGVDCVGLINNVWKIGTRAGMSATSGGTRAIRFEDLEPGDVLLRYHTWPLDAGPDPDPDPDHVVLFVGFIDYDPTVGPVENQTKVHVYESSGGYGRVIESIWVVSELYDHLDGESNKVTMERIQYLERTILNDGTILAEWQEATDHTVLKEYIPRTFFQPKDIVLIIDRSGSMNQESRIEQAKESANLFVDLMRPGDRIGIVAFDHTALQIYPSPDQPLAEGEIDSLGVIKNAAKDAVSNITPSGATSIGSGLLLGQQLLNTSDSENRTQMMILLSDGEENTAPKWNQVKGEITVPVSAMSIGFTAPVLADIVMSTNGSWYGNTSGEWVNYLFQSMIANTYREDIIKAAKSKVPSGGIAEQIVLVDSTVGSATFSLAWPGSDLDLTLVQPDGSVVDPTTAETDPNIEFVSGATYEFYKIFAPQKGEWTLRIFGKSTSGPEEDYSVVASAADAMILSVDTDGDEFFTNNPIKITASIEDSILDSPIGYEHIHGITIQVTASDPNNNEFLYELYDDGLHGDGNADDGVYANSFSNTGLGGNYNFNIQFSGNTNRDGQPFTREANLSLVVSNTPSVVSSLRAYANPTSSYGVNFTVTFSEPITGVDVSDFRLFTSGNLPSAAIVSVTGSGRVYTVTVNTGSGSGAIHLDVLDDDTIASEGGVKLGGAGLGNGEYATGETYDVDNTTSTTTVNKLADTNDGVCNAADCSLREAITAAAFSDAVTFDATLSGGTIRLVSALTLSKNVTIDGSMLAIPITISGDTDGNGIGDVQIFKINSGMNVNLINLAIANSRTFAIENFGTLTISKSTVTNNSGGVRNNSVLTILNSTFSGNGANYGGGVRNDSGTVIVMNSTFSGNSSGQEGGGIYNNNGTLTVTNSTFSGNHTWYQGGGISNYQDGILTVTNSTFSDNYATYSSASAGGIYNVGSGILNLVNTIVANSISSKDCIASKGSIITNINTLVEDGSCSASLRGDPGLAALADNGGFTQTMMLFAGSPAINVGDAASCANPYVNNLDQRGVTRLQGLSCDIGAYETNIEFLVTPTSIPLQTPTVTFTPTLTPIVTATSTATPTHTASITPTRTSTFTRTATQTGTSTFTPTSTPTFTATSTATVMPSLTPTNTLTETNTSVPDSAFPSTRILDDYNRANGTIGSNWSGNPSKYAIASNQLLVTSNDSNSDIYWSGQAFGADQEVYVTFANVKTTATEQDLILKSQSNTTWGGGMIEVWYDAPGHRVQVWTWEWLAGWVQHGADIPVTFVNGDTFGARALANGSVEVYKNGELLGVRDVTSWSYYDQGGYIGLWFVGANGARLDDFGGGTLPSGMQALMAGQAQANTTSADALDVQVSGTSAFWQGIPLSETASVTIAQIQTNKQVLLKPKSNGVAGEGTVQVLYDLANGRIQVWVYDPAKGWTQIGKDFPIKFAVGDKFTIRAFADGRLEILRNGKLIAKTKVTP